MKNEKNVKLTLKTIRSATMLGFLFLIFSCSHSASRISQVNQSNNKLTKEVIWHIKAINPEAKFLDVKALDKKGNIYNVKAIQDADHRFLMDVKAMVGKKRLPVKMLISDDKYTPVKAIGEDGTVYDIKAISPEGDKMDVKGIKRAGDIIHLKAISKEGDFYAVKAISPDGQLNDVKGVKVSEEKLEATVHGVEIFAHIKALPQAGCAGNKSIWHIKAINPKGKTINIKALDKKGNIYDVKAIQDANQQSLLDVRAFVDGKKLPVKMLISDDKYTPVKAIGENGTVYDIKAITPEGDKMDVKGISRAGNIIHLKTIHKGVVFYAIKAISPDGKLYDVKGIKMSKEKLESTMNGVKVSAHIKALPQTNYISRIIKY